jgi:hypothetical protein
LKYIDVFNGDADGICALHQLRMTEPRPARLITGVKRDIQLLSRLADMKHASVTVLDVSLDSNRAGLLALLANQCRVFYADHHFAGDIPENCNLEAHIDPHPETCTSLIVDQLINGKHRLWAIVGAFGDNLNLKALEKVKPLSLSTSEISQLKELGELLNYNGYGASVDDLHFPPWILYEAIQPFESPFDFYHQSQELEQLRSGFRSDMDKAAEISALLETDAVRLFRLPAESWSRRVSGVFINAKTYAKPSKAHALVVSNIDGTDRISVRAPLNNKIGADRLCRAFPTGGGRAGAAGVNALPADSFNGFCNAFEKTYAV